MKKLLPLLMALIGLAAGGGAGLFLRPPPPDGGAEDAQRASAPVRPAEAHEYVKLANQFIVPVMQRGMVASLVVLSLTVEVAAGSTDRVYAIEPKLRDAFLQVLFDHANTGGFGGTFTETLPMDNLRRALLEAAQSIDGDTVKNVLISDIVRQDS